MKIIGIILVILIGAFTSVFIKSWLQDKENSKSYNEEILLQSCIDNVSQEIPSNKAFDFCECAISEIQKLAFKVDTNMSKEEKRKVEEIRTKCKLKLKIR